MTPTRASCGTYNGWRMHLDQDETPCPRCTAAYEDWESGLADLRGGQRGEAPMRERERIRLVARDALKHCVPERSGLSVREWEVAALSTQGLSTGEIATELTISAHTVKSHLQRVFMRLGVRGRVELAVLLYRNGWLPADLTESGERVALPKKLFEGMLRVVHGTRVGQFEQAQELAKTISALLPQPRIPPARKG